MSGENLVMPVGWLDDIKIVWVSEIIYSFINLFYIK